MASPIPIQNVYYLLCYAWKHAQERGVSDVGSIDSREFVDLFAKSLVGILNHLFRRGLEVGYQPFEEELRGIRGRILLESTVRRMLDRHGRAHCTFDEITPNTLANQILKSTVGRIVRTRALDSNLKDQLQAAHRGMREIDEVPLSAALFKRVQLHGNNKVYKLALHVCEFAYKSIIPDDSGDGYRFDDFLRDEARMSKLFEDFIFNFYSIELTGCSISRDLLQWNAVSQQDPELRYLPSMRTDVTIRSGKELLVIDAKFYAETFQSHYGSRSIHSGNLYQLHAYLANYRSLVAPGTQLSGMLLYPAVDAEVRLQYQLEGSRVSVCTLDLTRKWSALERELFEVLEFAGLGKSALQRVA